MESNCKGAKMKKYRVSMVNTKFSFRNFIDVVGCSCSDAGAEARRMLGPEGYDKIEAIVCIGYVS